ncbi:MAG: M28 family peptidase [Vicingaceae bacterium]|jgi:Zn-dependent M28 family amino/carboxypeptidase|nr:M28 family peptidase [Vicingaceae bacterium]|tara:strand:- start:30631 stop:31548 length:918 start_codon:yes stop_codon:yes gene_type:complete
MIVQKHIVILFLLLGSFSLKAGNADTILIKQHLVNITKTEKFRNHKNINQLNEIANYIKTSFQTYTDSITFQEFDVNGKTYKNVIASFGTEHKKRVIIGAHYDVCGNQEGADDNASGVVGLLELARMLKDKQLNYRIDLVAYTLEEPPHFKTEYMGSYIHAKYLKDNNIDIYGMLSVEMIGYFSDEKKSQTYPVGLLSLFYGNKGNYITLVRKFGSGKFARKFVKHYKKSKTINTKKFTGPKFLSGIDFSDHLNYWKFGFSALMITDTSFYRNFNYHEPTDTIETLDIKRMARVINGIYKTITTL